MAVLLFWFPLLCGVCALAVLTLQSAAWMALNSTGDLQSRCRRLAAGAWWAVVLSYAAVTAVGLAHVPESLLIHSPQGTVVAGFAVLALAGLIGTRLCLSVGFDLGTFAGASCTLAGMLASACGGSSTPFVIGPTGHNSAILWIPALALAAGFNVWMHRRLSRKQSAARL